MKQERFSEEKIVGILHEAVVSLILLDEQAFRL